MHRYRKILCLLLAGMFAVQILQMPARASETEPLSEETTEDPEFLEEFAEETPEEIVEEIIFEELTEEDFITEDPEEIPDTEWPEEAVTEESYAQEPEMEEPSQKENRPFSNTEKVVVAASAGRLLQSLSRLISGKYHEQDKKLRQTVDRKQRREIQEKKQAMGLRD